MRGGRMDGRRSRPLSVPSAAPGTQPGFEFGPRQGGRRAQAPARLCPRRVQAPRGRHGRGAAVRSPGSALTPGVPGPGRGGWGLPAPDGSSLPSRPLPPCAPVADLSVFLGHVFLTCCSPPSPTAAAPSAPRPAPPWYPARPEPGLGPSAIYFQATVGFSVFTACLSLNGKSPTQLSSRGAVRGGGRA